MRRVVMLNLAEFSLDPRVQRICRSLTQQGYQVTVVQPVTNIRSARQQTLEATVVRVEVGDPRYPRQIGASLACLGEWGAWIAEHFAGLLDPSMAAKEGQESCFDWGELWHLLDVNVRLWAVARELPADVYHCNDLDTLLAGRLCASLRACPLVYDAHEIYPEQFADGVKSPLWKRFFTELEGALVRTTQARMTVCDALGRHFVETYGCDPFVTVRNCPSLERLPSQVPRRADDETPVVLYHGNLFAHRGLDEMIHAAKFLRSKAELWIRGPGGHRAELVRLVDRLGVDDKVFFVPAVPVAEMIPRATTATIGISPFLSVCLNTEYALPNKFFEYMMAGLAVASVDLIEMRSLTQSLQNGVLFDAARPEAIAAALDTLLADRDALHEMRLRSRQAAIDTYNWETEQAKVVKLYEGLGL